MTQSQSKIPFHNLTFHDDLPKLRDVEARLKAFLKTTRERVQRIEIEAGRMADEDRAFSYDIVDDADMRQIKIRSVRYLERLHSSTGMYHLAEESRVRLTPLKGGAPVARIATEHEADEIAADLHAEMPWMAPATEAVWHGLRASAREGLLGLRFSPLVLVGSPGIGKSFWARRLAHHLATPTTLIDAPGEPATFALVGSQHGWSSATPGKLMQTVLKERHGGPLVIVDEVEKSGDVHSSRGTHHSLTDALLPSVRISFRYTSMSESRRPSSNEISSTIVSPQGRQLCADHVRAQFSVCALSRLECHDALFPAFYVTDVMQFWRHMT